VHASLSALHWLDRLGVRAAAAVGHGLGEITGLVWAGTLSEPDAARLVAQRDAVLAITDPQRGGMVSIGADAAAAEALCAGRDLVIAAYNGPRCHVLAGSAAAIREVTRRAARDGIAAYVLGAPHAMHSPAMTDRVAPLRSVLADFEFGPPARRLISTVTGRDLAASDDVAALLAAQLTSPVRFAEALAAAGDADLLVETGPGQALAALAAGCCEVPAVSLAGRGDGAASARAAAALFAAGAITGLEPLLAGRPARPVDIWRERIFITNTREPAPAEIPEPVPQRVIRGRFLETVLVHDPGIELVADTRLSLPTDPYLADHRIDGLPVLPGVVGLEAMAQAASALAGQHLRHVTDIAMDAPVVIAPGAADGQTVIRVCAVRCGDSVEVTLRCDGDGFQVDHFRAQFALPGAARSAASGPADGASAEIGEAVHGPPGLRSGLARDRLAPAGFLDGTDLYGPICFQSGRFRRVAFLPEVTSRSCRALVRGGDDQPWFGAVAGPVDAPLILGSPGLNDATLHVLQACIPHRRVLPAGCESVVFSGQEVRGAVQVLAARQPGTSAWNVTAVDATGQSIVTWTGLRMQAVGPLAHTAAWHPALLAASLEGCATELGLDPGLRVAIRCAQRPASRAAQTQPAEASGAQPLPPRSPWLDAAVGTGPLDGFELVVRATRPVACHWATTKPPREGASPRMPWPGDSAGQVESDLARLGEQLHAQSREPRTVVTARLAAVAACLLAAGWRPGMSLRLEDACEGAWIQLRAGQVTVVCTIADIGGVPGPVAVALATWPVPGQAAQPACSVRHSMIGR
jgi:malonyl CoA-acyl carrier protein transacylase